MYSQEQNQRHPTHISHLHYDLNAGDTYVSTDDSYYAILKQTIRLSCLENFDMSIPCVLQRDVNEEPKRGSRLITGVFLWVYSIVPFFYGEAIPIFVVTTAVFCIFEGIVHIACFAMMQRTLMAMLGMRYKDMSAVVKKCFGK